MKLRWIILFSLIYILEGTPQLSEHKKKKVTFSKYKPTVISIDSSYPSARKI